MIDPPLWLVILPLAAAPLVYVTRRWGVAAYLAALVALLAGMLAWSLPPTNPMRLLGRLFLLDPLTQHVLASLFVIAAVLFLVARQLPQGRAFFPLGLILLGLLAAAGMSRHLGITALCVTLAAIDTVPIIQGEQTGSTRAGWRFLMMFLLALPFFLLASWRVDLYREDVENAVYLGQAALFLGLGMSVWLAVVPLHGWLTGTGAEAPPVAAALVLTGFPLLGLVTLLQLLREATWFTWHEQVGPLLLMAGLISAATGGLFAALQRGLRPLLGYAALFDMGCLLIAVSLGRTDSAPGFYAGLALRGLALGLTGAASAALGQPAGGDTFAVLRGMAYRRPLATAALVIGGFTLAGLPLTAGFLPRWLLLQDLAQSQPRWAWLLVGGGLGVAVGYLRGLHALLALPGRPVPANQSRQPWLATLFLAGLGLLSVWLGLFPDPLFTLVERLLTVYPLPPL